jgi:sortase A
MPGETGNVVVAGHRTVGPHPFENIDTLQPGDQLILRTPTGTFVYTMTDHAIVSADDTSITAPTAAPTLTLYACHPKGSDIQRYVVFATLTSPRPSEPAPPPAPPPPAESTPPKAGCGLVVCVNR